MASAPNGVRPPPVPLRVQLPAAPDGADSTLRLFEDPVGAGPGGAVWDAAVVLAQYVQSLGAALRGAAVIELGAGTGLPGLAAAKLGARVTLTDRERALPLLRMNAEANALDIAVEALEWGVPRRPGGGAPFALVLAADVVCHDESLAPLLATLRELTAGGAEVLLANKCRDVAEHAFWEAAAAHFHVELLQEGLPAAPRDGDDLPVMLYRLWPRQPADAAA